MNEYKRVSKGWIFGTILFLILFVVASAYIVYSTYYQEDNCPKCEKCEVCDVNPNTDIEKNVSKVYVANNYGGIAQIADNIVVINPSLEELKVLTTYDNNIKKIDIATDDNLVLARVFKEVNGTCETYSYNFMTKEYVTTSTEGICKLD